MGRSAALAGSLGSGFDSSSTAVLEKQGTPVPQNDTRQYVKAFIGIFVRAHTCLRACVRRNLQMCPQLQHKRAGDSKTHKVNTRVHR
jgi:hypothetical protein